MDAVELVEENLFAVSDAKLHGGMCRQLSAILYEVLAIFPVLEAARPRSKSGIQALCSLYVTLDKSKNLLQHCSECSKLYLAITGDSILMKLEKARCALQESLTNVQDIVPQAIGCQEQSSSPHGHKVSVDGGLHLLPSMDTRPAWMGILHLHLEDQETLEASMMLCKVWIVAVVVNARKH